MSINSARPYTLIIRPQIGPPPQPAEGAGNENHPGSLYYNLVPPESVERFVLYQDHQKPQVTVMLKGGQQTDFATEAEVLAGIVNPALLRIRTQFVTDPTALAALRESFSPVTAIVQLAGASRPSDPMDPYLHWHKIT